MKIIGISPLDKDSTVSFLEDDRVVFACGEERLSRTKLQGDFPHRALELGFERTGWSADEVEAVGYAFLEPDEEARLIAESARLDADFQRREKSDRAQRLLRERVRGPQPRSTSAIPGLPAEREHFRSPSLWKRTAYRRVAASEPWSRRLHGRFFGQWTAEAVADHRLRARQLAEGLERFGLQGKLRRFFHHDTHAANAFWASGFDEALLVSFDGYGSGQCGAIYRGSRQGIECLVRTPFPHSLGQYYESVTSALGFKPGRHEGKIVGLAAHGDPEVLGPILRERFVVRDGELRIRSGMDYFFPRGLAQSFAMREVAAAYQTVLEEVIQEVLAYWVRKTGLSRVAVSGGVHANVKLNQRIHEIDGVTDIFVYPNMGDGGCGTGAALLCLPELPLGRSLDDVYFGPDYSTVEIERVLDAEGLSREQPGAIDERVADLLAESHIVARFDGRMEYGPRALGNRSILYPAKDPEVNLWLNQQLGRTEFMPFAPAALAEHASGLFQGLGGAEKTSEFMTVTFDCTDTMKSQCPAAVHVDGTARPQLVTPTSNPGFHAILEAYRRRTGVPALINTSFNMHEEPIVCSPEDAVRAFLQGNIDYLAIGACLVPHPRLQEIEKERSRTGHTELVRA